MADEEASGEATLDHPVDGTVDTDDLGVRPAEHGVDATRTDAEFDYLLDEDFSDPGWSPPPPDDAGPTFDAFNASTWNFRPVQAPWYRTGHNRAVLAAVSMATVALVVSVVLLAFRGSGAGSAPGPIPDASTAPTTATAPVVTSAEAPPPPPVAPPPPPPPPTVSEVVTRAPVVERSTPPTTRKPEINVTRAPLSVHPNMPGLKRP
ncbi:hypothetical protein MMAD_52720 [Mycolicibacterium madagascariense]|uniref:Uncharacterized protein n=1 Tax=Mycolicibacterium madagascariense TaxID=212765 RepID=A0A7I7XP02_9MYCO|nr:hypothetical protein [Mycolicibacterium madagascariense]MCV7015513.1 hypothetical protein [Mycolicibacterium madagascariense]BBZ30977.1 hypothetical protein MMAD_52720 [Mycolicibacterium madagascariense]